MNRWESISPPEPVVTGEHRDNAKKAVDDVMEQLVETIKAWQEAQTAMAKLIDVDCPLTDYNRERIEDFGEWMISVTSELAPLSIHFSVIATEIEMAIAEAFRRQRGVA